MSKFDFMAIAAALAFIAGSAIGGQQFGRDSVMVQTGQHVRGANVTADVVRFGRDSVYVARDTRLSKLEGQNVGFVVLKPRRA